MYRNKLIAGTAAFLISMFLLTTKVYAQASIETFGQNRVQYRKYEWRYFETDHFLIYHYDRAGRQLARYIAEQGEKDIAVIEQKLGGQFPRRFKIILYNNYDEYRQTNVGKKYDSQIQDIPAGTVDLVGDRLVVYFTGKHADLKRQLRSGMSLVVMQRLLFGESFREMVKNAVLLNLPEWTTDGYIAYIVDGWEAKDENEWKNLIAANPNKGFFELSEEHPEIAGKAFWKYISLHYGNDYVKNLLYAMETKSGLAQGIKLTLGLKVRRAYDSCINFYKNIYAEEATRHQSNDSNSSLVSISIPKDNGIIRSVKISPRGHDVSYIWWKDGEYKVYLQNTAKQKTKNVLLAGGKKDYNETIPDPDYPLLAWSNNGYKLAMLYKKGTETKLRIYNSLKAKIENYTIPKNRFDRVTGISFMEEDNKMVFTAIKKSQTDLYEFTIRGLRMKNITDDAWDDAQPWFVSGGTRRGILFLSNRPEPNINVPIGVNQLPVGPMNVYFYDTKTKSPVLLQCSHVDAGNITQPIQFGSDNFAFLYDSSGLQNKYVVIFGRDVNNMDSAFAVPVTDYNNSILYHQYNPASNEVADVVQEGDKINVYFKQLHIPDVNDVPMQPVHTLLSVTTNNSLSENGFSNIQDLKIPEEEEKDKPLKNGNIFQSEFSDDDVRPNVAQSTDTATHVNWNQTATQHQNTIVSPDVIDSMVTTNEPDSSFIKLRAKPYRLLFKPDFFTIRLDNSIFFTRYQSVSQNFNQFTNPLIGGLLTISLDDIMENHRFTGGIRIPENIVGGMTYFLQYENFTNRVDWGLLYLRDAKSTAVNVQFVDTKGRPLYEHEYPAKATTNFFQVSASYPFDRIRSVRMQLGLRQDLLDFKATDTLSLTYLPRVNQYWAMSHVEYVFDNSIRPELNIYRGYRYKVFAEYMYGLTSENKGGFYSFGTDFRYYHPIYKNLILATRLAGAHSGGSQKILYYLGGVDNWLLPKQAASVPSVQDNKFAFQMLATNMRGYPQMSRIGNTYGVINEELRLPLITTFVKRPIQSAILRHLQLVGFADIGGAWFGGFDDNATIGTNQYVGQQVIVNLNVPVSTGLALGYGAGLRTMLFGYFMRLDAAWNYQGTIKPIWYFSIGTDF